MIFNTGDTAYIIENDINNKVYIGQAIDAKIRFQSHCKPSAATLNNELIGKHAMLTKDGEVKTFNY